MEYHDLEKMTVIQLREEAKKFPDLTGVTAMKKEELIHNLVTRLGIAVPAKTTKKARAVVDKSTLKKKIAALQAAKTAARETGDRKKTSAIRRRIHTVKRRLRKMA